MEDRGTKRDGEALLGEGCHDSRHNGDLWRHNGNLCRHNGNPSAAPAQLEAMGQWWNIALGPTALHLV